MSAVFADGHGRDPSAERSADDDRAGGQLGEDGAEVFDIGAEFVAAVSRPFAFAVSAKVQRDHLSPGAHQGGGRVVPDVPCLAAAVHQQHQRIIGVAAQVAADDDAAEPLELREWHWRSLKSGPAKAKGQISPSG